MKLKQGIKFPFPLVNEIVKLNGGVESGYKMAGKAVPVLIKRGSKKPSKRL